MIEIVFWLFDDPLSHLLEQRDEILNSTGPV